MSGVSSNRSRKRLAGTDRQRGDERVCWIPAWGVVRASLQEADVLRRALVQTEQASGRGNFLRHADEQSVTALTAVHRAMQDFGLQGADLVEWAVVSSSRYIGRLAVALHMEKIKNRGTVATSPHIIPQHSLHSISSAISVALGTRGPNFGTGGGPDFFEQGLMMGMALLDDCHVPRAWLTLTQWSPEPIPNRAGECTNEAVCHAVALALSPVATAGFMLHLHLDGGAPEHAGSRQQALPNQRRTGRAATVSSVPDLAGFLQDQVRTTPGEPCCYATSWGLRFRLELATKPASRVAA